MGVLKEKVVEWAAHSADFPPEMSRTGAVTENVLSGSDVDLLKFPVPKWHEQDGGRYIGTGHAVITRDPDTGEVNLGTYRMQAHDSRTAGLFMEPTRHGRTHVEKYHSRGQSCPVAVTLGHHPLILGVSGDPIAAPEYNYAGAIRGKPIKVIKEEVTGLPIPADSEIVMAGWCPPGKTKIEGPFGEWTGHASPQRQAPIVEVERLYYRNEPILLASPPSRPPSDATHYHILLRCALALNEFARQGIPDVKGVWAIESTGTRTIIVVSLKQRYAGHAKQVAMIASQMRMFAMNNKYVIVVDEDIDPSNVDDVLWAVAMRTDPIESIDIVRRVLSGNLDPRIRKPAQALVTSKAIIDACKPYEWMKDFPVEVKASPELENRVKQKWGKLLRL